MKDLIEVIMAEPQATIIVKAVQNRLDEESKKRQEYYDFNHQKTNAEFINGQILNS